MSKEAQEVMANAEGDWLRWAVSERTYLVVEKETPKHLEHLREKTVVWRELCRGLQDAGEAQDLNMSVDSLSWSACT